MVVGSDRWFYKAASNNGCDGLQAMVMASGLGLVGEGGREGDQREESREEREERESRDRGRANEKEGGKRESVKKKFRKRGPTG